VTCVWCDVCVCGVTCVWCEVCGVTGVWGGGRDLMDEGSSSEDHGQLTGVVGVVEPAWVSGVPRMEPPWKTNYTISSLSPHSANEHNNTSNWRASETLSGVYKFKICDTYTE